MDHSAENPLDRFIGEARELFDKEPELEKRWTELTPILSRLLADPDVLVASKNWPSCVTQDGRAENLLFYEDPDFGFVVNGFVKGTSQQESGTNIHDHAHIYTLYGVLDGHEQVERYERVDDGSRPGHAEIRKTNDVLVGPGEIDLVRPYEIHSETTLGERAVAVIIRSEKNGSFNQGGYQPETNGYYEFLGPRQTPYGMLPARIG